MVSNITVPDAAGEPEKLSFSGKNVPIRGVIVYANRAEVIRDVTFSATKSGLHEVELTDLPGVSVLDLNSLRVSGTGSCRVLDITHSDYPSMEVKTQEEELEEQEQIRKKTEKLAEEYQVLAQEYARNQALRQMANSFMESIILAPGRPTTLPAEGSNNPANGPMKLEDVNKAFAWWSEQAAGTDALENRLELAGRRILKTVEELRGDRGIFNKFSMVTSLLSGKITVRMDVAEPGLISIEIKYMVQGAQWAPAYDLRLDTKTNSMSCTYFAQVAQRTGEDWKGVSITLSTVDPIIGGKLPMLTGKTVSFKQKHSTPQLSPKEAKRQAGRQRGLRAGGAPPGLVPFPFGGPLAPGAGTPGAPGAPSAPSAPGAPSALGMFGAPGAPSAPSALGMFGAPPASGSGAGAGAAGDAGAFAAAVASAAAAGGASAAAAGGAGAGAAGGAAGGFAFGVPTEGAGAAVPTFANPNPGAGGQASVFGHAANTTPLATPSQGPPAVTQGGAVVHSSPSFGPVSFTIPQSTSVRHGQTAKLVMTTQNLSAEVMHYVVPSKESSAYLHAKATNDTEFHLLPSQDVSIFLDNTFVMKTSLDSVFPGESFQACLGVDPSVKIKCPPPHKVCKKVGVFGKHNLLKHSCSTTISNTKDVGIACVVVDAIPVPTDDTIKVTMKEPSSTCAKQTDASTMESLISTAASMFLGTADYLPSSMEGPSAAGPQKDSSAPSPRASSGAMNESACSPSVSNGSSRPITNSSETSGELGGSLASLSENDPSSSTAGASGQLQESVVTGVAGVVMNELKHMAWVATVAPQSEVQIPLEYNMEWPSDKDIEFNG